MAINIIPITKDVPKFKERVTLGANTYGLEFRYNSRMDRWILDLLDDSDVAIVNGQPLLLGVPLFDEYVGANAFEGTLFLLNLESDYVEAGENDLGENVLLLYSDL